MQIKIKDLQVILGLDYKTVVAELVGLDPTFKPTLNKALDDTLITRVCQAHGVRLEYAGDQDAAEGKLTISRSTDADVKVAPLMPALTVPAKAKDPYAANTAKEVLRSDLIKLNTKRKSDLTEVEAFTQIAGIKDARKIRITDTDLRDPNMVDLLLEGMRWLVVPAALPKRTRDYWKPGSIKVTITESINTHFIAFNEQQVLFIYF